MLALELDRRALEPPPAGGQLAGHAVECVDQRSELVVGFRLDAMIEVAGADLVGRRRQHLHRTRDALGEVEAHPRGADENHQREHQEEREVDAGQRLLQHAQLLIGLVGLGHAARARRELVRQILARDHDTRDRAAWARSGSAPPCESGRRRSRAARQCALRRRSAAVRSARRSADAREYSRGSDGDATSTTGVTCDRPSAPVVTR